MVNLYINTLSILLTTIKQQIESNSITVNNAALNQITYCEKEFENKNLELSRLFAELFDKSKHFFQDKTSSLRKNYLQNAFNNIRGELMQKILFNDESGLKL